jgi:hypothetical protein
VYYGGLLDITAAGHFKRGQTEREAAAEISEELGIKVGFERLIPLGTRQEAYRLGNILNREVCYTYLLENNVPITTYVLQHDEVDGLFEIEISDCMRLLSGATDSVPARGIVFRDGRQQLVKKTIKIDEILPRKDPYYLTIAIMAERYFEGRRPLSI